MYKLLVVDDEYNIRDGIVNAVPWEVCDVVVVGEACDGIEGLKRVEETLPDIIITDINMDNMNGLEFVKHIKEKHPSIKIIILSGYDEFEYAKTALQLKVFSYLLKPTLPNELIEAVQAVIKEICADAQINEKIKTLENEVEINKEVLVEKLLKDLANGNIKHMRQLEERVSFVHMKIKGNAFACLVFALDGYYNLVEELSVDIVNTLLEKIKDITNDIFSKENGIWSFVDQGGNIISILEEDTGRRSLGIKKLYISIETIKDMIRERLNVTISIGIGNFYKSILDVDNSYNEAVKALDFKMIAGKDCTIHIDDINLMNTKQFTYPKDKENAIILSLTPNNDLKIRETIADFFQAIELKACMKDSLRLSIMELFMVVSRRILNMGLDIHKFYEKELIDPYKVMDRFDTAEEIKNWFTNIVLGCMTELSQNTPDDTNSIIKKAQVYLESNYCEPNISLDSIAGYLYLSSTYFSKFFKKETGKTYMEYLTNLRMQKAKVLLKETNIRINDIGSAVGYSNPQYFITLFKKVTGKTPLDYRERE